MGDPIEIRMGGYGPATTGFSRALKLIGDRLEVEFGDRVDVKYVWNIWTSVTGRRIFCGWWSMGC
jgi:TRAP-type transport system periplasmic protein